MFHIQKNQLPSDYHCKAPILFSLFHYHPFVFHTAWKIQYKLASTALEVLSIIINGGAYDLSGISNGLKKCGEPRLNRK